MATEHGLTEKQEAFALAFMETGNAAEAYRRAYDVAPEAKDGWIYVEACQLLDHPKISLRLKKLREQATQLAMFGVLQASEEFEEARQAALKLGMPAAAVSATAGKVKLFGLDRPSKVEVSGPGGGPIQSEEVSALERVNRRIAGLAARLRPGGDTGGTE